MRRAAFSAAVLLLSSAALMGCGGVVHGPFHGGGPRGEIGTLLLLGLQVWGVVDVLRRDDLRREHQALWALVILLVPVIGVLAYVVAGRQTSSSAV